jgi:two-component system nitrate/nitrite response regulator NarL
VSELERQSIRVLVVAGTRLYREGLATYLAGADALTVVGTAGDAADAIARVRELRPDVVLLDVALAGDVTELRTIVAAEPGARVVAFGIVESEEAVIACAEAGVAGYVGREASMPQLVEVLEGARRSELVCSPRVAATLLRRVGALAREREPGHESPERLTSRETQIVALVDEGLSNKEIARRLGIELSTVKNHVHNVIEKLHVSGRSEAAARVRSLRRVAAG